MCRRRSLPLSLAGTSCNGDAAGAPDCKKLESVVDTSMVFATADVLLADIAELQSDLRDAYGVVPRGLQAKQLLSPHQVAEQCLSITVELIGHRDEEGQRTPLPKVPQSR